MLNNNKQIKKFLFIKADNLGKKIIISKKPRNQIRILEEQEINKIVKTYKDFSNNNLIDVPGFCKKADFEEIKEKDFTLNPGTYVGAEESNKLSQEEIKIELKKASAELFELMKEGNELEKRVKEILEKEINE
ncbi:N-6 DNA methylase [bacterium]|nr:N-6 DNA methylase [bacterium]